MLRLPVVIPALPLLSACGVAGRGADGDDLLGDAEMIPVSYTGGTYCEPAMTVFPVADAHNIGYEHLFTHEVYEFLRQLGAKKVDYPTFEDGVKCQRVLDAVEKASKSRKWEKV